MSSAIARSSLAAVASPVVLGSWGAPVSTLSLAGGWGFCCSWVAALPAPCCCCCWKKPVRLPEPRSRRERRRSGFFAPA